ncbi:MAG: periplasmic heavy metal sensor [Sphingobacteriia bacterium]|nr:MAG: periplasmic heavy metal sensor [Sphingobacteriia bacterium]
MNQLTKNRGLNIIVIVLLIANIVSFGIFWWRQSMPEKNNQFPPPIMNKGVDYLTHELNFSSTQQTAFEALRNEHRSAVDPIRKDIEQYKNDFFALVKNDTASSITINNAWNKIATAEKEMDITTLNHFKSVRQICDSAQKIKFDQIIQDAIIQMRNRPKGPPPPDGQRPHPKDHRPPPDGKGPAPQGHRPPPDGQGPPPQGHRPPPDGKGPPPQGHRPPPDGKGPPPQGHRPPPPPDQIN